MLREIKKLFIERKLLNLEELAIHFKVSENTMVGMLQLLIEKNIIEKIAIDCRSCNNGCKNCAFANQKETYKLAS